jgi:hypothetical protein
MIEAPHQNHQKRKPIVANGSNKYKIGVDKSDQMLAYHCFHKKLIKFPFIFLIYLWCMPTSYTARGTSGKTLLEHLCEKVAEGMLCDAGTDILKQYHSSSARQTCMKRSFCVQDSRNTV